MSSGPESTRSVTWSVSPLERIAASTPPEDAHSAPAESAPPASEAVPNQLFDEAAGVAAGIAQEAAVPSDHAVVIERHQGRNLVTMALYDIVLRIGWIFKTESVIMPAFLDAVAGAGWLRGFLPVVNRFGQSIPPALFAHRLKNMPAKKWALSGWTAAMGIVFLGLAAVWYRWGDAPPGWMAGLFLALYAVFSGCHGLNQLSYGTVQGKLIGVRNRGRLLAMSAPLGSWLAIVFALWLMGDWLRQSDGGFTQIFGFTGALFMLAATVALALREPHDTHDGASAGVARPFHAAWQVLAADANFRRFAHVVMLSGTSVILFPHYQALGRERLGLTAVNLMIWVVVQNAAVGMFGLGCGWLVHRWGERLALRVTLFGMALAPLTAIGLAQMEPQWGSYLFWVVFIPLGMTPISLKTMIGYTLEASPVADHPRYLSTLSLCLAAPFVLSPLVGWLVDLVGFEPVFLAGAALIVLGGLGTFRLTEPRHSHAVH